MPGESHAHLFFCKKPACQQALLRDAAATGASERCHGLSGSFLCAQGRHTKKGFGLLIMAFRSYFSNALKKRQKMNAKFFCFENDSKLGPKLGRWGGKLGLENGFLESIESKGRTELSC